jgi:uncharacterized membrane protein YkvA (DUF1232 family)
MTAHILTLYTGIMMGNPSAKRISWELVQAFAKESTNRNKRILLYKGSYYPTLRQIEEWLGEKIKKQYSTLDLIASVIFHTMATILKEHLDEQYEWAAKRKENQEDEVIIPEEVEDPEEIARYQGHFSEEKFIDKLLRFAKKAGVKVVYAACLLFYVLQDDNFPIKEKALVIGALGYFILPFDLIPDFIPIVGFADDLAALLFVVKTIYGNITPEVEMKAKAKTRELFGRIDEKEFVLF